MLEFQTSPKSNAPDLYKAARDAKASKNYLEAERIYNILKKTYPEDWEAHFYSAQCNAVSGNGFKPVATKFISELLSNTILLLFIDDKRRNSLLHQTDESVIPNLEIDLEEAATVSSKRVKDELNSFINSGKVPEHLNEYLQGVFSMALIPSTLGNYIEIYFSEKYIDYAIKSWKLAVNLIIESMNEYNQYLNDEYFNLQKSNAEKAIEKIRKYEPSYQAPQVDAKKSLPSSEGCYIATAVYGTYDSPELWTLRRFRDEILRDTSLGTLFVKFYYRISPSLVHYIGGYNFTKKCVRPFLDRFVRRLNNMGISSEVYMDK